MDSKISYKDAPRTEDREELLARADSSSSSMDEEKNWASPDYSRTRQSKSRTCMSTLREYWWLYNTGLLIIIIGLQLSMWHDMRVANVIDSSRQPGGDYTGEAPVFRTAPTKWHADPEFTPLNATEFLDPKIQAKWETLYPAGAGFVGGPDSVLVYNSTSVTHQIHCVYIMGKIFSAVLTKSPNLPEPEDYEAHFMHCVDYMRQAAMCAGDVTIEPRGIHGEPAAVNLENAFNGTHVCKDYSQVRNYLEEQVKEGKRNILPLDD